LEVLELESYLDLLRLDETEPCLRVCPSIVKAFCFIFQSRSVNYISVLVSDVLLVWLDEASLIKNLAVKLEFQRMYFAKVKVVTRIVASY
jgi:hypothetical protein